MEGRNEHNGAEYLNAVSYGSVSKLREHDKNIVIQFQ